MNSSAELDRRAREAQSLEQAGQVLAELLAGGYAVWADGSLYNIKELIDRVDGLKIHVFAREHPPPHFHVRKADIDAVFTIDDCTLIGGRINSRSEALVKWWYRRARGHLIATWNATRPSDCPVGPIIE